jgi:hypothetical protein
VPGKAQTYFTLRLVINPVSIKGQKTLKKRLVFWGHNWQHCHDLASIQGQRDGGKAQLPAPLAPLARLMRLTVPPKMAIV